MRKTILTIAILAITVVAEAQITQWRGENRDGIFGREKNLLTTWPEGGPQQILKVDNLGKGYSSPIYADNTIYVTGMKDTLDYLTALDMTGAIKWQVVYGRSWLKSFPDTRGSATIDGDRIYLVSGTGQLNCLSTKDGKTIWNINVDKDYESEWHMWGVAESPLILDNMVICSPGGQKTSIVAFDKMSGKEIWRTEHIGGQRSYVSPTLYNYNNKTYILATTATHLMAIHPESGKVAWSFKYWNPEKWDQPGLIWANTPIWKGDEIFISMGYNYRAVMLKVNADGTGVTEKFSNEVLDNHHHGLILHDGYVYASNWINNGKGNWVCMDWNTGEIKWETTWENKGSIVLAEGLLYLFDEKGGNVGLVKPNPEKFELISTFKNVGGSGPHWAHPFISDGKLFLRHGEMLMVYNIAK